MTNQNPPTLVDLAALDALDSPGDMRMDAYYYGFEATGYRPVDEILSAVARAGKAYHHTEEWYGDEAFGTPDVVKPIQEAANRAAAIRGAAPALLASLRALAVEWEQRDQVYGKVVLDGCASELRALLGEKA